MLSSNITVILPVRNEELNIQALLTDLENQTYNKIYFEVIVIDDHSSDSTREKVLAFKQRSKLNLQLISLKTNQGKKAAATFGVSKAKGDIIVCTDGDCRLPNNWLSTYSAFFDEFQPVMVSGPVRMLAQTFFGNYQSVEFSTLIGFGAATLSVGAASTCNGANMAYLRSAFLDIGGYQGNEHVASGDDEFLLQKMHAQFPGKVLFMKSKEAIVSTSPQPSIRQLVNQRIRWSSKLKFHSGHLLKLASLFVFLDFSSIFLLIPLTFVGLLSPMVLSIIILIRWLAEWRYLHRVNQFLSDEKRMLYYPLVSFIYPFYVLFLGIASIFGKYSWKGRSY